MIELELPDFSEITDTGQLLLLEKTVKHNGIWKIHKSDRRNEDGFLPYLRWVAKSVTEKNNRRVWLCRSLKKTVQALNASF
jgi:hypothetical protein